MACEHVMVRVQSSLDMAGTVSSSRFGSEGLHFSRISRRSPVCTLGLEGSPPEPCQQAAIVSKPQLSHKCEWVGECFSS